MEGLWALTDSRQLWKASETAHFLPFHFNVEPTGSGKKTQCVVWQNELKSIHAKMYINVFNARQERVCIVKQLLPSTVKSCKRNTGNVKPDNELRLAVRPSAGSWSHCKAPVRIKKKKHILSETQSPTALKCSFGINSLTVIYFHICFSAVPWCCVYFLCSSGSFF